jgi:hypothetical protein
VNFDGTERAVDRAYFGLTAPANGDSGGWELHIEVYAGGDPGCPTAQSASPDQTLIVTGVPVPENAVPVDQSVAAVSLLDFEGALLPGTPVSSATALSVTAVAANPCVECASGGSPTGERLVAVDVSATFAEGTAAGHLFATHCDSLDDL